MEKMKNSGIEWIGEIPEDWSVIRLKHSAWLKGRIGWQGLRSDEFKEEGPYLITGTDFDNGIVNWNTCVHITESRFREAPEIHIHEDDLLITKDGTIGKTAIAKNCPEKVSLNSGVFIVRNTGKYKYVSKFLYYIIQSNEFTLWFDLGNVGNSTIKHLNQEMFYNFQFALPPLETQKRIADFLDAKCGKIDGLKNDIQKQIETLEHYKKSVITEAVTKGINPNAKMKDSGIEWIGEIPEHWEIHPVYYYFEERKHKNTLCKEQNLLSLSYGNVIRKDINALGGLLPESFNTYNIIEKDDIVIRPTDLQNDKRSLRTGLCKEHGIITSAYITLMPKQNVNSHYFHYLLHAYDIEKVFYNMGNGVRQGLNYSEFAKLLVISPTKDEQKDIVAYLDEKCSSIDSIITAKKQQLEKLEEYKKSLIFEYVTGKREVSGEFSSKTSEKKGI